MNITSIKKSVPYKLGFIGGSIKSAIGYTHHIASKMDNRFVLEAGCFCLDSIINIRTAKEWGVDASRLYHSWYEFLDKEQNSLDAIVVLTPTPDHFAVISKALELGYPVICEKAVTTNSADAERLKHLADEHKGFLVITYNYSGYPMLRELKHRVESGELGTLQQIQVEMPQESFLRRNPDDSIPLPQNWRQTDHEISGVSLDLGSHCHHLIQFLTNKVPQYVVCDQSQYGFLPDVVDDVTAIVRYNDQFRANIWYSKASLGSRNGLKIRLFGSECSAEWIQEQPEQLLLNKATGERMILDRSALSQVASKHRYNRFKVGHPSGFIEAFANLYVDIFDCLDDYFESGRYDSEYVFGIEHALEGLYLFESMQQSMESNAWVSITKQQEQSQECNKKLKNISYAY